MYKRQVQDFQKLVDEYSEVIKMQQGQENLPEEQMNHYGMVSHLCDMPFIRILDMTPQYLFHIDVLPVSYTHLDVYKRQPYNNRHPWRRSTWWRFP